MPVIPFRPFAIKSLAVLFLSVLVTGCKTYSEEDKSSFDKKIEQFAARKSWEMNRSTSGLYSQVLITGDSITEAIKFSSEVTLKYKGKLLTGRTVDQSLPGRPLVADLNGLIAGFQEGLLGQRKGAKVRLIIPPHLGYGDETYGKIPANSVLVFEIEVIDVH